MAEYKKFGAAKKLIVAGCCGALPATNLEQIPEVDAFVGTGEMKTFLRPSKDNLHSTRSRPPFPHTLPRPDAADPLDAAATPYIKSPRLRSSVHVCIIPQLARKFRSGDLDRVRERKSLAALGSVKVTLIGQDPTSYGEDLGTSCRLGPAAERWRASKPAMGGSCTAYPNRVTAAAAGYHRRNNPRLRNTWTCR